MSLMNSRRGHFFQGEEEEGCIPGLGTTNRSRPHYVNGDFFGIVVDDVFCESPVCSSTDSTCSESSSNIFGGGDCQDKETSGDSSQMRAVLGQDPNSSSVSESKNKEASIHEQSVADSSIQSLPIFSTEKEVFFIQGGTIANDDGVILGDIIIRNGIIEEVGEGLECPEGSEIIDAQGKYVVPGGIDVSVNLGLSEDYEDGTKSALSGGTTLIMDLVVPKEGQSLTSAVEEYKENAENKSYCDYCLRVAIPRWDTSISDEMDQLAEQGIIGFKAYMSDSMSLNGGELLEFLHKVKSTGGIAQVHAENGEIIAENQKRLAAKNITGPEGHLMSRPEEVEEEAVNRVISYGKEVALPLIISGVSGNDAIDLIAEVKDDCKFIMGEPSLSSLFVDGKEINSKNWSHAAGFVTSPPIRDDPSTMINLWNAIINGSLELVSSHHHTNSISMKRSNGGENDYRNIYHGVNGVEERLSLLWEKVHWGEMKLEDFVKISSSNAAKTFGLYPQKGRIEKGSDADITIMNPKNVKKISLKTQSSTRSDLNVFQGIKVHGIPEFVFRGGEIVVYNYILNSDPQVGKHIQCSPFPESVYSYVREYESASEIRTIERQVEHEESFVTASSNYSQPDDFGLTTPRSQGDTIPVMNAKLGIYQRPVSAHGIRNQQDSTFSLSSSNDEDNKLKSTVKITAPSGGGHSRGFW